MTDNNIDAIVKKWTDLKLISIVDELNSIDSFLERKKYIGSFKRSINNLFHHNFDEFEIEVSTELVMSNDKFDLTLAVCLELNDPSYDLKYKRETIEKVNYGEILIPKYASKGIKHSFEKYIHRKESLDDVKEPEKNSPLILAFIFDRVLIELGNINLKGKIQFPANKNSTEKRFCLTLKKEFRNNTDDLQIIFNSLVGKIIDRKTKWVDFEKITKCGNIDSSDRKIIFCNDRTLISFAIRHIFQHLFEKFYGTDFYNSKIFYFSDGSLFSEKDFSKPISQANQIGTNFEYAEKCNFILKEILEKLPK